MENHSKGQEYPVIGGLIRDFMTWPVHNVRFVDEIECLIAVLLAILVSHLLGISNASWAAVSAYMVIRASFAESLKRGSLRLLGTAAGALLALMLAPELLPSVALLSIALALIGGITLYLALLDHRSYGWMFAGLTFSMVLLDGMEHVSKTLGSFALSRFVEVLIGTCASILVSALSALTLRRNLRRYLRRYLVFAPHEGGAQVQLHAIFVWHKIAFLQALQGATALALLPWVWTVFHISSLSQSSITIITVMVVPLANLAGSDQTSSIKLRHRFYGCGIGGALALGIMILSQNSPLIMMLAACIGIVAGRHIENSKAGFSYVGTQFALVILVVLVPDSYAMLNVQPGLDRLLGILIGMGLLEPARLLIQKASIGKK